MNHDDSQKTYSTFRKIIAWSVHAYTSLGLVIAALMAVLIIEGGEIYYRWVFVLFVASIVIDGTDGFMARGARVKQVTPGFDGRRLDDIIDFHTYTSLPLFFLWSANVLPSHLSWVYLAPLLASAYGFCQTSSKTADGFFIGFPSYWNVVAFYVYILQSPPWFTTTLLLFFSFLTFVPSRYLYPTQKGLLNRITLTLSGIWGVFILYILGNWLFTSIENETVQTFTWISITFPIYYLIISWGVHLWLWQVGYKERKERSVL